MKMRSKLGRRIIMIGVGAVVSGLLGVWLFSHRAADGQDTAATTAGAGIGPGGYRLGNMDEALAQEWLTRWEKNITRRARNLYCDRAMGEQIGWLMRPFLDGFYYGYLATGDPKWVDMEIDWADSLIKRGAKGPDGYVGWPGRAGPSYMDNLLGEAMVLRPLVLMAGEILKTPTLKTKYAREAQHYIKLAEQMFEKWDSRGCWREVKEGGLWVIPPFSIDQKTGKWTDGYERRNTDGFSHPANMQNYMARWLLAMYHVTKKPLYRQRAEKWWRLMKSRMRLREGGQYYVWNYWDPAGPWDYKPDGSPKHWVGVHPNGGYYAIDVNGIVAAYEHGLVFTKDDIKRLIATNRDFMRNRHIQGAKFQRIDGGRPDKRWINTPGVLWTALVPYDETLRKVFEANHNPASWGGLSITPWYLARHAGKRKSAKGCGCVSVACHVPRLAGFTTLPGDIHVPRLAGSSLPLPRTTGRMTARVLPGFSTKGFIRIPPSKYSRTQSGSALRWRIKCWKTVETE